MSFASDATYDIFQLALTFASHTQISLDALSRRVRNAKGFFASLEFGADCTTAIAENVVEWFDANWPRDLAWPESVARLGSPSRRLALLVKPANMSDADAAYLADLTVRIGWGNGRRPPWWGDLAIREMLTKAHRQMTLGEVRDLGQKRFGTSFPSISGIHRYWEKLDLVAKGESHIPRPPKTKKEAA